MAMFAAAPNSVGLLVSGVRTAYYHLGPQGESGAAPSVKGQSQKPKKTKIEFQTDHYTQAVALAIVP